MMSKQAMNVPLHDGELLRGYQKKLKTMKKKYFVLYAETTTNCSRLEYFDNEKKFKTGSAPKRIIKLKNCFNINRRLDTKHEFVISLSTKDGGFGIVLETKAEMLKWLEVLYTLQRIDDSSEQPRPYFEHVWQVVVQRRGLAEEKGIVGEYHVCLTPTSLTFIRIGSAKSSELRKQKIEFVLTTVRRCGDSQCFFYMEVGRQSIIGPGELWMETEDALIAQNMHQMILSAMSSKNDTNIDPMRKRSSSANEATKPLSVLLRKQVQPESKPNNSSYNSGLLYGRERCDSLPSSRNRASSDISNQSVINASTIPSRSILPHVLRPQSMHHCHSPPVTTAIGCSESEESSLSIEELDDSGQLLSFRFNSRSSDGVIPEENNDESACVDNKCIDEVDGFDFNIPDSAKKICSDNNVDKETRKANSFLADTKHLPMHIRSFCSEYSNRVPPIPPKLAENIEQSYILMEPAYRDSDRTKYYNKEDNCKLESFSSMSLVNCRAAAKSINFSEYTSDSINTNCITDGDVSNTCERPTRAYSIGSRQEHNKLKMGLSSSSEVDQTTSRVRAFSVGSRAKIPRCDLQRGLLNYKSSVEQNSNSSSNNIKNFVDTVTNNQFLNLSSSRDKKSTSAPLLINKTQNSADRMGDLMEIDFSKSPNSNYHQKISSPVNIYPFSTSVPVTDQDQAESFKTFLAKSNASVHSLVHSSNTTLTKKSTTDNGYLEMKPVSLPSNHNLINNTNRHVSNSNYKKLSEPFSISPKATSLYFSSQTQNDDVLLRYHEINDNPELNGEDNTLTNTNKANDKKEENSINCNIITSSNIQIHNKSLTNKVFESTCKTLQFLTDDRKQNNNKSLLKNTTFGYKDTICLDVECITMPSNKTDQVNLLCTNNSALEKNGECTLDIDTSNPKKLGIKDTNLTNLKYIKEFTHKNVDKSVNKNESGYEILQIKSDSSIQSNKTFERPSSIRLDKQSSQAVFNRPSSANSGCFPLMLSAAASCSASGMSAKNENSSSIYHSISISDSLYCVGKKPIDTTISKKKKRNSRPPSASSERELNYASLDLPLCSSEKNSSADFLAKNGNLTECSTPLKTNNTQSGLTYSKINFEHCDSSSNLSSKLLNST